MYALLQEDPTAFYNKLPHPPHLITDGSSESRSCFYVNFVSHNFTVRVLFWLLHVLDMHPHLIAPCFIGGCSTVLLSRHLGTDVSSLSTIVPGLGP